MPSRRTTPRTARTTSTTPTPACPIADRVRPRTDTQQRDQRTEVRQRVQAPRRYPRLAPSEPALQQRPGGRQQQDTAHPRSPPATTRSAAMDRRPTLASTSRHSDESAETAATLPAIPSAGPFPRARCAASSASAHKRTRPAANLEKTADSWSKPPARRRTMAGCNAPMIGCT